MDQDAGIEALLDLNFLTEEEQNAIVEVLQRDLQLQMSEEGRINKLRKSISDPNWLKIFSGEWFHDVRSKRHQCNLFGADIVRASIRRKKKPKAGEQGLKQQSSLKNVDVISEPVPEDGKTMEAMDVPEDQKMEAMDVPEDEKSMESMDVLLPKTSVPQSFQLTKTPEPNLTSKDVVCFPESAVENTLERSSSFSSLNSEIEEQEQPGVDPAVKDTMQNNSGLENGQGSALVSSPSKANPVSPSNKGLNASSSASSLSSSTMSGSVASMFSDNDIGSIDVRGCVQFSLRYDSSKKEFHIQIIQCRDLAEAKKQRSDPYVKTYLLPDRSNHSKRKTAVKKRSLDPIFNETLKYKIEKAELHGRILNLSVWHHDSLGRNLFLGEVEMALNTWDWSNTSPKWFNLQPKIPATPDMVPNHGKLSLALKFIPAGSEEPGLPPTGELHMWVKNAENLVPQWGTTVDAFVQCYILPDDTKLSRQKTRIVKKNLNPTFNHTMVYDGFELKDLAEACAEFTVWHRETFSKHRLGGIRLSLGTGNSYGLPVPWMDSTEEERHTWEMVFKQPRQWVEATLPLRTNLTLRTSS
ncbi:synaptotagmin-like protein 1 isoform X1 [Notechis scutatus]|uniref:Synaptotagmin-like protein 1 n=1 Tax=Notechis scutatus TaxID=8663 RepID=A0A6J1ULW7_9SAUR|nr:synaptotagmin-like protein 1 isoform X1 [Notechis scutatus]XP_026531872.1 synaptotagmin-like protein 1 isoform X1 [Notechis scutatus]